MHGMTQQEIGEFFSEVKRVFPEAELLSITLQNGDGTMAFLNFSKEDVGEATSGEFALLPVGKYSAEISDHEWKATQKGGHMLALTLEVTGPEYVGRKLWDNLNLDCDKEEAQKIAVRTFKSICEACGAMAYYDGLFEVEDADQMESYLDALPEQLYAKNITVNVGIEKGKDGYADKNKIKGYMSVGSASAPSGVKPPVAGKPKPSWAK